MPRKERPNPNFESGIAKGNRSIVDSLIVIAGHSRNREMRSRRSTARMISAGGDGARNCDSQLRPLKCQRGLLGLLARLIVEAKKETKLRAIIATGLQRKI